MGMETGDDVDDARMQTPGRVTETANISKCQLSRKLSVLTPSAAAPAAHTSTYMLQFKVILQCHWGTHPSSRRSRLPGRKYPAPIGIA